MPKTRAEVSLRLFDELALKGAIYSSADIQPFANLDDLKVPFDAPGNYSTLEPDQWSLDGSKKIFPDDMSELKFGYWSLSQSDEFSQLNVMLLMELDGPYSTDGITIFFYEDEYANDIDINWYDVHLFLPLFGVA